ncbi:sugar phosphate isomerase/epimerase family protein [Pelosinus propionicus]|uniref:Sugar phosphate isomerase/epimerase n=1 Tax=Pelosinus propionicus DSM 13327 TaxID=1123291 RepID=A0A1I4M3K1_9FIRM|nr:sugar phosphate isomerase/epimerase family protein [Pelosinus propionicus]SFL97784.1 Sugar phosphate isomerase/epimerase [Pelosinus propionicus DSM 13327]
MKTSVSLSLFNADKTAPVLFSGDIETNIPYISSIGYAGVDLFVLDPLADISKRALRLLADNNLGVGVVMPAALAKKQLFMGDVDSGVRKEIIRRLKEIIAFSAEAGAMVSLGLVRGSVKGNDSYEAFFQRFADTCEKLIPFAEQHGVKLLIEPINRYEINTLNSSQEAFEFIQKFNLPLFLMLDTFHMNIEDVSIEESFVHCQQLVRHIHFLDSNRRAPGMGHLEMTKIYELLKQLNYDGYLCLEALSLPDSKTCALKGIEFFAKIGLCG